MKKSLSVLICLFIAHLSLMAQCDDPFPPADDFYPNAPVYCAGLDGFCSTVPPFSPNVDVLPGCNGNAVLSNYHWLSFIAGNNFLSMDIEVSNCSGGMNGGNGLQVALYTEFGNSGLIPIQVMCEEIPNFSIYNLFAQLEIGQRYYLLIDGFANSICDYQLFDNTGATIAPPQASNGPVEAPEGFCAVDEVPLSVAPVDGATYVWDLPLGVEMVEDNGADIVVDVDESVDGNSLTVCVEIQGLCNNVVECSNFTVMQETMQTDLFETVCEGECYDFFGELICNPGAYVSQQITACQTINYTLTLSVEPLIPTTVMDTICLGECLLYNGELYCEAGTYEIALLSASVTGCDSIVILELADYGDPVPDLTVTGGALNCLTQPSVELQAVTSVPDVTYLWSGPDINQSNETLPNPVVDEPGTYTVQVTSANGCTAQSSTVVTGNLQIPELNITGNEPLNCNTQAIVLFVDADLPIVEYEWSGPGGFSANGQTVTVSEPGTYLVKGLTASACQGTLSVEVVENDEPLGVDAGPDQHFQCLFTLQLDAPGVVDNNDISYEWTTDDGNILNGANTLTPTINDAGTYILTATDLTTGCSGSDEVIVYNSLAVLEETVLSLDCTMDFLILDGSNSYDGADASINWTTTTGNIVSGGNTLTPTVDQPGTYQLVIIRPGCVSFATLNVLNHVIYPNLTISANQDTLNCLSSVFLTVEDSQNSPDIAYRWFANNVPVPEYDNQTTVEATEAGNWRVEGTNDFGCTSSTTYFIINGILPSSVEIVQNGGTISCANLEEIELNAIVDGFAPGLEYNWSTSDGNFLTTDGDYALVLGAGTYGVEVINPQTGCVASNTITLEAEGELEITFESTPVSCPGSYDGSITAIPSGGCGQYIYLWNTVPVQPGQTISNLGPGIYEVTVTDCNGCTAVASYVLELSSNSAVVADAGADAYFDCLNSDFYVLDGSESQLSPDAEIEWTTNDGEILDGQGTLILTVGSTGTYTLTIVDPFGCEDSDQVTVFESTANAGPNQEITCATTTATLDGSASQAGSGVTYAWSTNDGNIVSGADSPNPTVNAVGTYTLTVTSSNGCTASDEVSVTGDFVLPQASLPTEYNLASCVDPVILEVDVQTPGATVTWDGPGGFSNDVEREAYEPGEYSVVVSGQNGCTITLLTTVIDNRAYPQASAPDVQYINCFNGNPLLVDIDFMTTNSIVIDDWSTTDGAIVDRSGNSVLVEQAGTYTVSFSDDITGCANTAEVVVAEDGLSFMIETELTSCGEDDGIARVITTGISEPTYSWSNGATTQIVDGLAIGTYFVTVSADGATCEEVLEVIIGQDPSCFVTISGSVFNDDAALNCELNGPIVPLEGVEVRLDDLVTFTDASGYYEFSVPAGDYTLAVFPESPYVAHCPASGTIAVSVDPGSAGSDNNNFFLDQLSGFDLFVTAGSSNPQPGQNQQYYVTYCNNGFQTIFGTIVFRHDPLLIFDPVAAGATSYDPATFTATWEFSDLTFFECEYLNFTMQVPADAPEGYVIESEIAALPLLGDQSPGNNTVSWQRTLPLTQNIIDELPTAAIGKASTEVEVYPNPFSTSTTIEFQLSDLDAAAAQLDIFDVNGRLVSTSRGFQAGENQQRIERSDLPGAGVYFYRLRSGDTLQSGRLMLR